MKFDPQLITGLKQELLKPLPGEEIRHHLSPPYRPILTKKIIESNRPKIGGVLLLIYQRNGILHLVFTKRKIYEGVHSGQISLPGGKKDPSDKDLIHTALRETEEEIGVPQHLVKILGSLSELYIPPSNFLVFPSVGFSSQELTFHAQEQEVEEVVEIPVSFFMDDQNINPETLIKLHNGSEVIVPAFIFNEHIIWGATAIILYEFAYLMKRIS